MINPELDLAQLAGLAGGTAAAAAALVPLVRRAAVRHGVGIRARRDATDANRAIDATGPTPPRLGGVALAGAVALGLAAALALAPELRSAIEWNTVGALAFAGGALLVHLCGVLDDVRDLRPVVKLGVEVAAAVLVVVVGGCRIEHVALPGASIDLGLAAVPVTVLWIVTINAINLIDGLDGLAAGLAAIALTTILGLFGPGHASVPIAAALLVGACLGFLPYNLRRASIFLGDSGSLFLGFSLGVLSIYAGAPAAGTVTLAMPLLVALPLLDVALALARRYGRGLAPWSGRSHVAAFLRLFVPDLDHIHHRLVRAGLTPTQTSCALFGAQVLSCLAAFYVATHAAHAH